MQSAALIRTLRRIETVLGAHLGDEDERISSLDSAASSGGTVRGRSDSDQGRDMRTPAQIEASLSETNRNLIRIVKRGEDDKMRFMENPEKQRIWHDSLRVFKIEPEPNEDNKRYLLSTLRHVHSLYDPAVYLVMGPDAAIAATLLGFMRAINPEAQTFAEIERTRTPS